METPARGAAGLASWAAISLVMTAVTATPVVLMIAASWTLDVTDSLPDHVLVGIVVVPAFLTGVFVTSRALDLPVSFAGKVVAGVLGASMAVAPELVEFSHVAAMRGMGGYFFDASWLVSVIVVPLALGRGVWLATHGSRRTALAIACAAATLVGLVWSFRWLAAAMDPTATVSDVEGVLLYWLLLLAMGSYVAATGAAGALRVPASWRAHPPNKGIEQSASG